MKKDIVTVTIGKFYKVFDLHNPCDLYDYGSIIDGLKNAKEQFDLYPNDKYVRVAIFTVTEGFREKYNKNKDNKDFDVSLMGENIEPNTYVIKKEYLSAIDKVLEEYQSRINKEKIRPEGIYLIDQKEDISIDKLSENTIKVKIYNFDMIFYMDNKNAIQIYKYIVSELNQLVDADNNSYFLTFNPDQHKEDGSIYFDFKEPMKPVIILNYSKILNDDTLSDIKDTINLPYRYSKNLLKLTIDKMNQYLEEI